MSDKKRAIFLGSKDMGLGVLKEMHNLDPDSLVHVQIMDDRQDTRTAFPEIVYFCTSMDIPYKVVATKLESERHLKMSISPDQEPLRLGEVVLDI